MDPEHDGLQVLFTVSTVSRKMWRPDVEEQAVLGAPGPLLEAL